MKKFLTFTLMLMLLFPLSVSAGMVVKALDDADGTALSAYDLTGGAAVYSEAIRVSNKTINAALLAIESKPAGAGDVDISLEYSVDKITWYAAYTTSSGTVTVDANIYTALSSSSRWVVFVPQLAPYIRYKFDPDADSTITATHIHQETR